MTWFGANGVVAPFVGCRRDWHGGCNVLGNGAWPTCPISRSIAMKTETFLLKSFFVAAVLTCVLAMGSFVTASPSQLPATVVAVAQ